MKSRKQFEKWGVVALAGLCVFLVFRLASEIWGNPTPVADPEETISQPAPTHLVQPQESKHQEAKAPANSDPALQVQPLEEFPPNPLPDIGRNPFDFGVEPPTPAQQAAEAAKAAAINAAPPPPRIPFQAIGYSENTGLGPQAFLADSDQVYIVHDGDVISHQYKILRITPSMVEVKDGASGETAQLPIPQVQ